MDRVVLCTLTALSIVFAAFKSEIANHVDTHRINADWGCRQGVVIVTLRFACASQLGESGPLATAFGIASVDAALSGLDISKIQRLAPVDASATSEGGRWLYRTYSVWYENDANPHDVVSQLTSLSCVEYAEVDKVLEPCFFGTARAIPLDQYFSGPIWRQWSLDYSADSVDVDAPEAWAIEKGSPEVALSIIDTGIGFDRTAPTWQAHPDFAYLYTAEDNSPFGQLTEADIDATDSADQDSLAHLNNVIGVNYSPPFDDGSWEEDFWKGMPVNWLLGQGWNVSGYLKHGTYVASIAASKATFAGTAPQNIAGIANGSRVYIVRRGSTLTDEIDAVISATDFARVVNISYGFCNDPGPSYQAIFDWTSAARDVVFVAAVGNISSLRAVGCIDSTHAKAPSIYPSVIGVANMDSTLHLHDDSVIGGVATEVDLVAPTGDGVPANSHSDCKPHPCPLAWTEPFSFGGTSASSPHVAGIAALIRSRFPNLNRTQVRARLEKSAEYYWSNEAPAPHIKYGYGKVNAYRALTEWGNITNNTTWSLSGTRDGKYYISGDLTIESGAALTINPGVVVKIAPDHEKSGTDPTRVKIVVKSGGTLNIIGVPQGAEVTFESFTDAPPGTNDWSGIEFEAGSSGTVYGARFRNAYPALTVRAPITLQNVTIEDGYVGIDSYANLTVTNSIFRDLASTAIFTRGGNLALTDVEIYDCWGPWSSR